MTTNAELNQLATKLNIPNFRGVICRDEFNSLLPALENETGIYNFNDSSQSGSHWAAYCKRIDKWYHFCSYGSDPCKELKEYATTSVSKATTIKASADIMSHTYRLQEWDETNCGEWCILFCYLMSNEKLKYEDIVLFFFHR
jgi:hypothetical protein